MRLHVIERGHAAFEIDCCLVLPIFEEPEPQLGTIAAERDRKSIAQRVARGAIRGKAHETYYLATPDSPYGGILTLGLGKPDALDAEVMRRAAGEAAPVFSKQRHSHIVLDASSQDALPVEAFVEGIMLAQYDFHAYKKPESDPPAVVHEITVLAGDAEGLEELRAGCGATVLACQNTNWARDRRAPLAHAHGRGLHAPAQEPARGPGEHWSARGRGRGGGGVFLERIRRADALGAHRYCRYGVGREAHIVSERRPCHRIMVFGC